MALVIPVLFLGLASSLSPTTTVVFIFLLSTSRARLNGVAFMIGWGISLTVVFTVSYAIGGAIGNNKDAGHVAIDAIEVLLGAVLLALAVRQWRRRKEPRTSVVSERFQNRLADLRPWEAGIVGLLKQPWSLTAAAAVVVVHHHSAVFVVLIAFLVFTLVSTFSVAAIFVYYARHPTDAESRLADVRKRLIQAAPTILSVVSLLVGCYLAIDGAVRLATR